MPTEIIGVMPILGFTVFTSYAVTHFLSGNSCFCDLPLEMYYLTSAFSIVLLLIEHILYKNGYIKNRSCNTLGKFRDKKSLYLSLLFYTSFFAMTILEVIGLEKNVSLFYLVISVFSLSFTFIRQIEIDYKKNKDKITEAPL